MGKASSQIVCIGFGLLLFFIHPLIVNGDDPSFRLRPLKYQQPELEVDLGVGLWAFPIPLDFDLDGDFDLLVSCPDKPSSGIYFFENDTQDPKVKFPVFKSPKHLGRGFHFMMSSRVNGEDIILRPNYEYRRNTSSGTFDFNNPQKIQLPKTGFPSVGRIRGNMWRYVDFNGDGNRDLVFGVGDWSDYGWDHAFDSKGKWRNGPLHGQVYVLLNRGNDEAPQYADQPIRLQAGGSDIDVYGWPSPNFVDFDGDGDLDLLCGEFLDRFTYFQNSGTRSQPEYESGVKLVDTNGKPLRMHLQMITPTAIDWDRDGDMDLIVGDEDGRVALVEHSGRLSNGRPIFKPPVYFRQQADTLKFGALATPFAFDWDGDDDEDILCGNTAGEIGFFENVGKSESGMPIWNAPVKLKIQDGDHTKDFRILAGPSGSIQGPCEAKWGYTTFSVIDWDNDGDGDILFNSILGRLGVLLNENGLLHRQDLGLTNKELPPKWDWDQKPSNNVFTQWRTTPLVGDFDGDKQRELILLDQQGYLRQVDLDGNGKSDGNGKGFLDGAGNPLRLNSGSCGRSGRVKLAMVDWDGDSQMDLLVNSENATWYRNCGSKNGKTQLHRVGNLAKRNVSGHTSSPTVCDFNQDGLPDLLVGSENGRIYFLEHSEAIVYGTEKTVPSSSDQETNSQSDSVKFPGWVKEEFVFEKAPHAQCHASTICQTSRGLVAAWFGGTKEGKKDVGIWTSYHDGTGWSKPIEVANGIQHKELRYPCWNPVLFQPPGDSPTLLFFKVGPNPREWWGELLVSYDRGRTFRNRRRLPVQVDGPVRCKPILIDGNKLLCGSSTEYDGWKVHFEIVGLTNGVPRGTWDRIGPINDAKRFNAIQPTFLRHADGKLQVLCRTREGRITTSFSSDKGKTWSKLQAIDLPNPNSGIEAVSLSDGRHLLVYNHLGSGKSGWGRRGLLNLAISNNGLDWHRVGTLEQEKSAEFSYPAIIQLDDGLVHISYTWKRKRIKHVVLDPEKFKRGQKLDMKPW